MQLSTCRSLTLSMGLARRSYTRRSMVMPVKKREKKVRNALACPKKRVKGITLLVQVKTSKVRFMGYPFC